MRLAALSTFTQPQPKDADGDCNNDGKHWRCKYHDFQAVHSRSLPSVHRAIKCRQPKQPSTSANMATPLNGNVDSP
jgi:hypothetical protein